MKEFELKVEVVAVVESGSAGTSHKDHCRGVRALLVEVEGEVALGSKSRSTDGLMNWPKTVQSHLTRRVGLQTDEGRHCTATVQPSDD